MRVASQVCVSAILNQGAIFLGGAGEWEPEKAAAAPSQPAQPDHAHDGTGKTVTLQTLAGRFSIAGVPVLFCHQTAGFSPAWQRESCTTLPHAVQRIGIDLA
nr:helicase HerA-like domain-containing protein [Paracoccus saliphilus]